MRGFYMLKNKILPIFMVLGILITDLGGTKGYANTKVLDEINKECGNYGVCLQENNREASVVTEDCDNTGDCTNTKDSGPASDSRQLVTGLASSYRNKNVPVVRNQGSYGTCWAFTSIGLAELDLIRDGISNPDLSELHLAYFNYNSVKDPLGGLKGDKNYVDSSKYNYLTLGGDMAQSLYTLASWKGVVEENKVSYEMAKQSLSTGISDSYCYDDYAHLQNAYVVNISKNPNEVKKLIKEHGGVGINYCDSYKYYNETKNCYYSGQKYKSNHAVIVVGWDDNFSKDNFTKVKPSKNGAWLIRNSWGKNSDGHSGYFWLSYEEPSISTNAYAFDFVYKGKSGFYDNNYQYDGSFANSYVVYGRKKLQYANVFTACSNSETEILKAVGVRFCDSMVKYKVDIYLDPSSEKEPDTGELVSSVTGKTYYEGFYTIKLKEPVVLEHGQKYSVVITHEIEKGDTSSVAIEGNYAWSGTWVAKASAQEGESFIKSGLHWNDCGKLYDANVRVKAFTDNESGGTTNETYRIEYVLNGGVQNPANAVKYTAGKSIKLYSPVRGGMRFDGWYQDSSFNKKITSVSGNTKGNLKLYAKWSKLTAKDVKLAAPKISSVSSASSYVTIKWKKAANAQGYYIYKRIEKGSWKRIATLKNAGILVHYDEAKMKNGIRYEYKVVAYTVDGSKEVTKASTAEAITFLEAPKVTSITKVSNKTRKLKFQRNKKASGYEIQYSTNKNFSKATKIKISKNSTTTAVLKKLQNKKKYYIRIRACKKVGKKTYYGYWRSYYVNNN